MNRNNIEIISDIISFHKNFIEFILKENLKKNEIKILLATAVKFFSRDNSEKREGVEIPVRELAKITSIDSSNVAKAISNLIEKKYLILQKEATAKRGRIVTLNYPAVVNLTIGGKNCEKVNLPEIETDFLVSREMKSKVIDLLKKENFPLDEIFLFIEEGTAYILENRDDIDCPDVYLWNSAKRLVRRRTPAGPGLFKKVVEEWEEKLKAETREIDFSEEVEKLREKYPGKIRIIEEDLKKEEGLKWNYTFEKVKARKIMERYQREQSTGK